MQSPTGDDALRALRELRRLVHGIHRASFSVERSFGVTGAQLFVLRELAAEPRASIRALSERTLTDPSSVSVLVARLVERGLVSRARDPLDRRKSALSLTPTGRRLLARAPEAYQGRLIKALAALSPAEVAALGSTLARVSDALGLASVAPPFFEDKAGERERPPRGTK